MSETLVPAQKTNNWAVVSLVLGIISFPIACCGNLFTPIACIALPVALAAVVLGFVANRDIKASEGTQAGGKLALAGIILGAVAIVIFVLLLCFAIIGLSLMSDEVGSMLENINSTLESQ